MRDAARIVRIGDILLAGDLLAGGDVPQAELGFEPAVAGALTAPAVTTNCALTTRQASICGG